jgi:hypothetical protein
MHWSQFAGKLHCLYCDQQDSTGVWPARGDSTPFYAQEEPGAFTVDVTCLHCGRTWYVVWDDDPGPVLRLDI